MSVRSCLIDHVPPWTVQKVIDKNHVTYVLNLPPYGGSDGDFVEPVIQVRPLENSFYIPPYSGSELDAEEDISDINRSEAYGRNLLTRSSFSLAELVVDLLTLDHDAMSQGLRSFSQALKWEYLMTTDLIKTFSVYYMITCRDQFLWFLHYWRERHNFVVRNGEDFSEVETGGFISEAPKQFFLQIGAELGYHVHIFDRKKDTGWIGTIMGGEVYVEPHRIGKVKNGFDLSSLGGNARVILREDIHGRLSRFPESACRRPSIHPTTGKGKAMSL